MKNFLHNFTNSSDKLHNNTNIPIKSYIDAEKFRKEIMADNTNKSGIYRWVNNITKNTYVGSGIDLSNRLNRYYHKSELTKKNNRPINQALVKYGHNNFTLEILEYCPKTVLLIRENYYFDLLKPEYNILKYAYSMLGFKHSEYTISKLKLKKLTFQQKQLLSLANKNKIVSEETRKKLSAAIADFRKNNPLSAKNLDNLRYLAIKREGVAVSVLNSQTNEVKEFSNQKEAGAFIGVTRQSIYNAIVRKKPIRGIFYITKKKRLN